MCLLLLQTLILLHFIFLGAPWFRFSEKIKHTSCNVRENLLIISPCSSGLCSAEIGSLRFGWMFLNGASILCNLLNWMCFLPLTVIAFCTLNFMLQALIQCIKVGHLRGKHTFKSKNKINFLTVNKHWGTYAYFFVDWATWVLKKVGSNFSRKKRIVCECVCARACVHTCMCPFVFKIIYVYYGTNSWFEDKSKINIHLWIFI